MSEPEATQAGEPPIDAPTAPAFDPSAIRGLQAYLPADATAGLDEAARKEALAAELSARAARLAEAVDDALVLANDGAIRWLGDPIAKLAAGETPLAPRAVLLADDALPTEGREIAERRVSLWLAEHMRKVLGPLIGLADAGAIAEPAREIALKVSQALGVLDRERVKAQVKNLDQEARGALRKLGVRFGAHYIFVPALLKPSARTLCAHLWALSRPDGDGEGAAEKLLHFAASGRTSFAVEPPASAELYRVAGFRLCGERAVRVDIVERLTDLIRVALPRAPALSSEADGFVVTNQMTSLTGCSGEHFASILRSLGFVAQAVKKSAYLAAAASRAAASAAPVQPAEAPTAAAEGEPVAGEPAPASEPPAEAPAPEEAAVSETIAGPQSEPVAETATPAETEPQAEAGAASEPQADAPAASEAAASGEEEMIEIWRLAPRRPRHPPHRHRGPPRESAAPAQGAPAQSAPGEADAAAQTRRRDEGQPRKPWREGRRAESAPGGTSGGAKAERSGEARRGPPPWRRDKGAGKGHGGDRREDANNAGARSDAKSGPESARPASEPRKPSVNLDSPFAKLLDLKPLLQSRDKGR